MNILMASFFTKSEKATNNFKSEQSSSYSALELDNINSRMKNIINICLPKDSEILLFRTVVLKI